MAKRTQGVDVIRFFLTILIGLILGTVGHEIYHYLAAPEAHLIITSYGVGIASKGGSSEVIAYAITGSVTLLFVILAIKNTRNTPRD